MTNPVISINTSEQDSESVAEFRTWVEAEWGEVDPFFEHNGKDLPALILAHIDEKLVGGLSFTYYSLLENLDSVLWINILLVAPRFRLMGIGSKLILAAQGLVESHGFNELYVFTEQASIYQKLGWCIHADSGKGTVLIKKICA